MWDYEGGMRLVKVLKMLRKEDWDSGKWLESLVRTAEGKNMRFFTMTKKLKVLRKIFTQNYLF